MTATPTPGDLSARLLAAADAWPTVYESDRMVSALLREAAVAIQPGEKAVAYREWHERDIDKDGCHVETKLWELAPGQSVPPAGNGVLLVEPLYAAALSALPAAGGLDTWQNRADREKVTTPQPSAAEGECTNCGRPKRADRAIDACACASLTYTPPPDAAVGAQGDGYDAHEYMEERVAKDLKWFREERASRLATPAAGKGVDEIVSKAQEFASSWSLVGGRFDDGTMLAEAEARKSELRAMTEAALTRQPVAGDGMVLVPREPTPAMLIPLVRRSFQDHWEAGKRLQSEQLQRSSAAGNYGYQDWMIPPKTEYEVAAGQYLAMLAAAPAAGKGVDEPAGWNIRRRNGGLLITGPGGMSAHVDESLEQGIAGVVLHALARDLISSTAALTRQPVAGDGCKTGTVADYPDADLLRRAVRYAARHARRQPAWARIGDVFALGSTYSAQLCRRFGIDPKTGKDAAPAATPTDGGEG